MKREGSGTAFGISHCNTGSVQRRNSVVCMKDEWLFLERGKNLKLEMYWSGVIQL